MKKIITGVLIFGLFLFVAGNVDAHEEDAAEHPLPLQAKIGSVFKKMAKRFTGLFSNKKSNPANGASPAVQPISDLISDTKKNEMSTPAENKSATGSMQNQSPTADFLGVVERADILQVNEREANLLHRGAGKDHETFLSSDLEEMLSRFNGIKPSVVIVTLGDKGAATVAFRNGDYEIYSHRPHYVEKVVDTTGSGDCFLAAFIYAQAQGIGHESSVDFASWVAAKNCLGKGGHFAEVDRHSVQGFPWRQPTKSSSEPCLA